MRNTGASGGLASGYPVLVTLAALAVTAMAAVFVLRARGPVAAVCLAAVLGGAAGNLSDRLFRGPGLGRGGVVDWIHLASRGGSMDVADVAIQFGVIGAVIALMVGDRARRAREARQVQDAGQASQAGQPRRGRADLRGPLAPRSPGPGGRYPASPPLPGGWPPAVRASRGSRFRCQT